MRYILFKQASTVEDVAYAVGDVVKMPNDQAGAEIASGRASPEGAAMAALARGGRYRVHLDERGGNVIPSRVIIVLIPVSFGGIAYAPGEVVRIPADEAATALLAGTIGGEALANIAIAAGAVIRDNLTERLVVGAIKSVFGKGVWDDTAPWNDADIWKD